MAVLANSVVPVYNIESIIFEFISLPAGSVSISGNVVAPQTGLIYTVQPIPMVLVEQKIGPESSRQTWS